MLMLGVPAKLAGCSEIVVCSPPNASGLVAPAIAAAALQIGLERVYCLGGSQAIAAMTLGTETVPQVDKLFGPGNSYVTAAKAFAQANFGRAIDLPAGPTEVLIVADGSVPARFIAADLLAQAEHGADSDVVLACLDNAYAEAVRDEVQQQPVLKRARSLVFEQIEFALEFANEYAAEHLLLMCEEAERLSLLVKNAGSVFLGAYTPESLGDYASGTNHTLPTAGAARSYSGVSIASFQKQISFQRASYEGLQGIAPAVIALAESETLKGHADAVRIRLAGAEDV
ncbi:UNVERIFIED_CONTAM: hypothetical protein GTU68_005862 [Idotea baltica]|nr:hypothetical protein [Idotea baltica]